MVEEKKITAVVVTYNRKKLLNECIEAILNQTMYVEEVIIIDNNSTDGTEELLSEKGLLENKQINYKKLNQNLGGAGGFYEGIKSAIEEQDSDFIWLMDDDTIPMENCVEELYKSFVDRKEKVSFMASSVKGIENEPMNVPIVDVTPSKNGYPDWYMNLNDRLVRIKSATFVSLLISTDAIRAVGLPCKDFFIWGDDTEYTSRLIQDYGKAYMVGSSWVCHKRKNAKALSLMNEDDEKRIKNYVYLYRNNLVVTGLYSNENRLIKAIKIMLGSTKLLNSQFGFSKFKVAIKGTLLGLTNFNKFSSYIQNEKNRYNNENV